jgi:TPR repeat/Glycosyltransferase family 9 (heptosyltransferase)/Tetratricopeptide repeat
MRRESRRVILFIDRSQQQKVAHLISQMQQAQILHREGRLDDARTLCEDLLREVPGRFEALSLLALIAAQQGDFERAIVGYDRVIAIKPDFADGYSNRGASFAALNQVNDALENFDRAIAIDPDHVEAHVGRAIVWLLQGDFTRGWREFEWRWKTPQGRAMQAHKGISQPLWLGAEDLAGKTILLHSEKGLGDTLQFCRLAKCVSDLGATVLLQVQGPLVEILEPLDGVSRVFADPQPAPAFDVHCPLLSLPLALKIELTSIPTGKYLRAPPASVARWRAKLGPPSKPRVGLVWRGDPNNAVDHTRSLALTQLLSLLPDRYRYVSLQKELNESERRIVAAHSLDFSLSQDLNFTEAAALCAVLDLVISVDTSVAHLSAALGQKTWILLPFNADCRWLLDRSDSPWYDSVTLYRQASRDDWRGVLTQITADLNREFA